MEWADPTQGTAVDRGVVIEFGTCEIMNEFCKLIQFFFKVSFRRYLRARLGHVEVGKRSVLQSRTDISIER